MKIALKYGLLITLFIAAWVLTVRVLLETGPESALNTVVAPILFNVAAFIAIYAGIKQRKTQLGDQFIFKNGMQTGAAISLVYAVTACLFFVIQYLVAGPKLLLSEAGPQARPLWQTALLAYAGLFFGALIFGVLYAAVSSFFLARQQQLTNDR
jgi:hypothetical protein